MGSEGVARRISRAICSKHVRREDWVALMAFGPLLHGQGGRDLSLILVTRRSDPRVRCLREHYRDHDVFLAVVGKRVFERDIRRGVLGELLADKLLIPYLALEGKDYLSRMELELKRRLVIELLLDVASSFPEFASEIFIEPRYFMYEIIYRMGRLMPSSAYMFANLLSTPRDRMQNEPRMLLGFISALRELAARGLVVEAGGFFRITPKLIRRAHRALASGFLWRVKGVFRSLSRYALKALSGLAQPYLSEKEFFQGKFGSKACMSPLHAIPRPEEFLLIQTSLGLRPAFREAALEEIARAIGTVGPRDDIEVSEIGGSLNLVYLVSVRSEEGTVRLVVKRFRNWNNLKWLSLRLWTLGVKKFAISGRERLKREYTMSKFLHEEGFPVPRIFHVDLRTNSLVQEFMEGDRLSEVIKAFLFGEEELRRVEALVEKAGRLLARIHELGVSVGDYKPENVIVRPGDQLGLVDLEQATRDGDKAWDVAEFLYYSGHYVPSVSTAEPFESLVRAFVRGYLGAGGSPSTVGKAPSAKFARVFSIFTPPQVMEAIDRVCGDELQ